MARNVGTAPNHDVMPQVPLAQELMSDVAIRDMVPNTSDGNLVNQKETPLMPNKVHNQQLDGKTTENLTPPSIKTMTDREAKEYKKNKKKELDTQLLQLNLEREKLDLELSQMPQNSRGKTVAQRHRRKQVEYKLDELVKDIGRVKRELRVLQR